MNKVTEKGRGLKVMIQGKGINTEDVFIDAFQALRDGITRRQKKHLGLIGRIIKKLKIFKNPQSEVRKKKHGKES